VEQHLSVSESVTRLTASVSNPKRRTSQETLEYVHRRVTVPLLVRYGLYDAHASATRLPPVATAKMAGADAADSIRMAAAVRCHLCVWLERAARGMVEIVGDDDVAATAADEADAPHADGGGVGGAEADAQRRGGERGGRSGANGVCFLRAHVVH